MTQPLFDTLLTLLQQPVRSERGLRTDNSILLIYPPERELDFRDQLLDSFIPALKAKGIPFQLMDLTGFIFQGVDADEIETLQEDEFDDYRWMVQGLSQHVEAALHARLAELGNSNPGANLIVFGTIALYPLVRFAEVLRTLRYVNCRIVLAFPGEERGGRLHFMSQPDGGNYLAVKLFWR
jgi:hypothetical protein